MENTVYITTMEVTHSCSILYKHQLMQMPQVVGQMPSMVAAPHPAPHNFLILAVVTTIICGILNLLSLAFGIPAIILAILVKKPIT